MARLTKYDVLRVVSSFFIVLLHVSSSYWDVVDVHSRDFAVMTVYNSFTRFAVPVFLMLSGMFLVSPERDNKGLPRRILRMIILFYIWSAFYAFQSVGVSALKGEFVAKAWHDALERFIFGHMHMWFIQMLVGFYILIPVAKQICAKKEILQYYLLLWGVFRYIFPTVTELFHWETLQARIDSLGLDILAGFFGYFLLGYYLNSIEIERKIRYAIYTMGLASLCITPILTIHESIKTDTHAGLWFTPAGLNVLLMSISIFVFFKYCRLFEKLKTGGVWKKMADYTFFIYMFHIFIIEKLNLIGITTVAFPAIISVPVITVFAFGVSLLAAFVVDHIPVVRKLLLLH